MLLCEFADEGQPEGEPVELLLEVGRPGALLANRCEGTPTVEASVGIEARLRQVYHRGEHPILLHPIPAGSQCAYWCVEVRAEQDGEVVIANDGDRAVVPVRVRPSLPPPQQALGLWMNENHGDPEWAVSALRHCAAHGCNTATMQQAATLELACEAFAPSKVPIIAASIGAEVLSRLQPGIRERWGRELLGWCCDEPGMKAEPEIRGNAAGFRDLGFRTVGTPGLKQVQKFGDALDVWLICYDRLVPDLWKWAEVRGGAEVWAYCSEGGAAGATWHRYLSGVFTWAWRLRGFFFWAYRHFNAGHDIGSETLHQAGMLNNRAFTSPDGPVDTPALIGMREGVADRALLEALERECAGREDAGAAARWLDEVRQGVFQASPTNATNRPPRGLSAMRRQALRHLETLQEGRRGGTKQNRDDGLGGSLGAPEVIAV